MAKRRMLWRLPFGPKPDPWPLVAEGVRERCALLAPRFADLDDLEVEGLFRVNDRAALAAQKRYRRLQLGLILGAALTSFFGALQLVTDDPRFAGIAIAVTGMGSSLLARLQRGPGSLNEYLQRRSKAEKLRSLYFRYLCAGDGSDPRLLEVDLAEIVHPIDGGRVR